MNNKEMPLNGGEENSLPPQIGEGVNNFFIQQEISETEVFSTFPDTNGMQDINKEPFGINFEYNLTESLAGNPEATDSLLLVLSSRMGGYFARTVGNEEAEDLSQQALISIYEGLETFDPELGRGTYTQNFLAWSFSIARNIASKARKEKARTSSFISIDHETDAYGRPKELADTIQEQPSETEDLNYTMLPDMLLEEFAKYFTPTMVERLKLCMEGKTDEEIGQIQGASPRTVNSSISNMRTIIENNILTPHGITRVTHFPDGRKLSDSAYRGRLKAIKFMNVWYTTEAWVSEFRPRMKQINEELLQLGYVLLADNVTNDEHSTLHNASHRNLIRVEHGIAYIKATDLEQFRASREISERRIISPEEGYVKLSDCTTTMHEYKKLLDAARSGKVPVIRHKNWWFIRPEDAKHFLNKN